MVLTYQEAVEAVAGVLHDAHWRSTGSAMWALVVPACRHCRTQAAAALKAVGYADLLAERDAARATLDRARAMAEDLRGVRAGDPNALAWVEDLLRAALADANSQPGRDLEQPGSSVDVPYL